MGMTAAITGLADAFAGVTAADAAVGLGAAAATGLGVADIGAGAGLGAAAAPGLAVADIGTGAGLGAAADAGLGVFDIGTGSGLGAGGFDNGLGAGGVGSGASALGGAFSPLASQTPAASLAVQPGLSAPAISAGGPAAVTPASAAATAAPAGVPVQGLGGDVTQEGLTGRFADAFAPTQSAAAPGVSSGLVGDIQPATALGGAAPPASGISVPPGNFAPPTAFGPGETFPSGVDPFKPFGPGGQFLPPTNSDLVGLNAVGPDAPAFGGDPALAADPGIQNVTALQSPTNNLLQVAQNEAGFVPPPPSSEIATSAFGLNPATSETPNFAAAQLPAAAPVGPEQGSLAYEFGTPGQNFQDTLASLGLGGDQPASALAGDTSVSPLGVTSAAADTGGVSAAPTSTEVATQSVGPDTSLADTGDLRVLNAMRGGDAAASQVADLPVAPAGGDISALPYAPGGGPVYTAEPASVPASGGATPAAPVPATPAAPVSGGASVTPDATSTPVPAAGGGGGIFGNLGGILSNPSALLAGGGLVADVLRGNSNPPGYNQIAQQAADAQKQGKQLQGYLASGTLPPGLQTSLDTARADAEASVRSRYAQMGISGSSAEAQDIQNLHNRIVSQGADMAMQLFQQGVSETDVSAKLYELIMNEQIAQDNALSSGITNMVTALASMGKPLAAAVGAGVG